VGACFDGASTAMVAIYGNPFLLSVAGIAPYHASVLQLAVRVVSAANDPVIGYLSDNVATRSGGLGRRRMLIALALVPLTVFFVLLWRVPLLDSEPRRAMYYLGLYFLYDVAATFVKVNYECLTSEMTYHEHERTAIVAGRHLAWVASASAAAMGLSTALAVTVTGPAAAIAIKQQYIFAGMGIVLIGAVMLLPTIAFAVERREWKTIWDDVLWLARFGGARWDPPQTELHPVRDVYVIDDAATAKGGARDGAGLRTGVWGAEPGARTPRTMTTTRRG
jgi:Na+/melibiose symporter-like transporter